MIFEFSLLGLFVIFFLMTIYYSKEIKTTEQKKFFKTIMIVNYIIEFLYLGTYMTIYDNSIFNEILSKLYLTSLIIFNSLIISYIIIMALKNKYKLNDTSYLKRVNMLRGVIFLLDVFVLVVILCLPIKFNDNILGGLGINITFLISFIYSIIGFLILFVKYNDLKVSEFKNLFVINMINITSIILQYSFNDISIINSGYVIITLYIYLTLESTSQVELETLRLEHDSALKSSINTSKFLTNMSYEIRTPLNAIDGLSQVIEDSDDIKTIKEDVKDIRVASKNLIDIINGIIDISTIETGKMEIVNENYDVYTMFENVCDIVKSRLKDSDVKFKVDISKNIPTTLLGDSARMEQILLNLLTNAIKYTKDGYILFKVDAINSSNLCRLKMTISDTGIGIKKEDIKTLFERNNTKAEDGNKLGLVIVKKLVELMNGRIDVQSTYNKGSTFVVTIDQKVVSILNDNKENGKKEKKLNYFDASGKRILVVDDNKLNLKVANKLLSLYNVEVIEAMSGQECLDILDNDTDFDLILMDDMMPSMTGSETLDVILKIERVEGFHIPIVVLTANAISGMKEKYLNLGFEDYLAKPIDKYELNRVLIKFLKDKDKENK